MTGVLASLGVRQLESQILEVSSVLVVVAQVQLHSSRQLLLAYFDVLQSPFGGVLPLLLYEFRQHHIDIHRDNLYTGCVNDWFVFVVVTFAAYQKHSDQQKHHSCLLASLVKNFLAHVHFDFHLNIQLIFLRYGKIIYTIRITTFEREARHGTFFLLSPIDAPFDKCIAEFAFDVVAVEEW